MVPLTACFLLLSLSAFAQEDGSYEDDRSYERYSEVDIVDPYNGRRAVAGDEGWEYAETGFHDLNGNGNKELVVLIATADVDSSGDPVWGHGHRWQLYIRDLSGKRTCVFADQLTMMHPKVSVTKREDGKRSIVLRMHRPHLTFAAYEILYDGTGEFQTLKLGYRNLSGELQNPSEFVRNRAPHRSAEELRETMDLLSNEELDEYLNVRRMTEPGIPGDAQR